MLYDEIMKIVTLAGEDGIERKNKKIDKMNLVQKKNQPVEDEDEDW